MITPGGVVERYRLTDGDMASPHLAGGDGIVRRLAKNGLIDKDEVKAARKSSSKKKKKMKGSSSSSSSYTDSSSSSTDSSSDSEDSSSDGKNKKSKQRKSRRDDNDKPSAKAKSEVKKENII